MKNSGILGLVLLITPAKIEVDLPLAEIEGEIPVNGRGLDRKRNLNWVKGDLSQKLFRSEILIRSFKDLPSFLFESKALK